MEETAPAKDKEEAPIGEGDVSPVEEEASPAAEAEEEEMLSSTQKEVPAEEPEQTTAEDEAAPAPEDAAAEEAPAAQEEAEPEETAQEEAATEETAPSGKDSGALETQAAPSYYPANLTVTNTVDSMTVKWTHGTLPGNAGADRILVEGRDITANGGWIKVFSDTVSNGRTTTSSSSVGDTWGDLNLVTRHEYEFNICYTSSSGERGQSAVSGKATYYNKDQEKALLKQRIQNYLTNGLSPEEKEDKVYANAYDEIGMTAGKTELFYNRPLYQLDVTFKGASAGTGLDSGSTMLNFHADYASRVPNNGFAANDPQ